METSEQAATQQEQLNGVLGHKYQILCRIGGGGMAQVYLARHRLHGGLFAVKVLVEHLAQDPRIVARFEQEARMAATLAAHPNIVSIFDIGSGGGLHYMIMQFIPGEDMASYLRREGRLNLPDAANIVAQAAEALSCAETKRIVHRDLKLANMLLDEAGRVKLLDFGISRIADFADGLTRPGESMGTPYYMSPEQIRGESCDIRSDLYSLGVVFFELISGHRPFENESVVAIQMAHLSSPPPSLLALDPSLPSGCNAIVQKLLSKEPEQRYQSTQELLSDLFKHGAQAGPGTLRPHMDRSLKEIIECAEAMPLDPATTPTATPVAGNSESVSVMQVPPASVPAPEAASGNSAGQRPRWMWPMVATGILLVVLLGAGGVLLFHTRHSGSTSLAANRSAPASALPSVFSDVHGRMMLVGAGSFLFGRKDGPDARTVALPAFYIDETEVSNAEYKRFCDATGHPPPRTVGYAAHPDLPVSGISYDDAKAYAAWAGKRLPTEEEWEKAARGTDGRTFPWGDAPWNADVPKQLQAVNAEPSRRSPYGAYNMAGNVWEWTASLYTPTPDDVSAMKHLVQGQDFSSSWQVIKGGSFSPGGNENFSVASRRGLPTDARSPWIGFRCVRDAGPVP